MNNQYTSYLSDYFNDNCFPQLSAVYLIDEFHNSKYTRLLHSHESELELYYAYRGHGHYIVDGRPYAIKQGDLVVCNAGILHGDDHTSLRSLCSYCCAITNVSLKGMKPNCLIDSSTHPIISCGSFSDKIASLMELIHMFSLDMDHLEHLCNSLSCFLVLLAHELFMSKQRHEERRITSSIDILAKKIRNYLDNHYCEKLTLESVGESLKMAPSYISHIFKQETGIAPMQYVLMRRFGEAQSLLMDTDLSINEISDLLGFANTAHFNAMFKKYVGLTPGQYRKSIREIQPFTHDSIT